MEKITLALTAGSLLVGTAAVAEAPKAAPQSTNAAPMAMTDAQMDSIVAGNAFVIYVGGSPRSGTTSVCGIAFAGPHGGTINTRNSNYYSGGYCGV